MSKEVKRIWNKDELTIAYYIAKWDFSGLKISEHDIIHCVIGNTTTNSLNIQVANFRYLLNIEGRQLKDASLLMKEICDNLDNKTVTQVRRIIFNYIDNNAEAINCLKVKESNYSIKCVADKLNEQEAKNFENKLSAMRGVRRLKFRGTRDYK